MISSIGTVAGQQNSSMSPGCRCAEAAVLWAAPLRANSRRVSGACSTGSDTERQRIIGTAAAQSTATRRSPRARSTPRASSVAPCRYRAFRRDPPVFGTTARGSRNRAMTATASECERAGTEGDERRRERRPTTADSACNRTIARTGRYPRRAAATTINSTMSATTRPVGLSGIWHTTRRFSCCRCGTGLTHTCMSGAHSARRARRPQREPLGRSKGPEAAVENLVVTDRASGHGSGVHQRQLHCRPSEFIFRRRVSNALRSRTGRAS